MAPLSPERAQQRILIARIGGYAAQQAHPGERVEDMRRGMEQRFQREARERWPDLDGGPELEKRIGWVRKEHYARLALAAAIARDAKAGKR